MDFKELGKSDLHNRGPFVISDTTCCDSAKQKWMTDSVIVSEKVGKVFCRRVKRLLEWMKRNAAVKKKKKTQSWTSTGHRWRTNLHDYQSRVRIWPDKIVHPLRVPFGIKRSWKAGGRETTRPPPPPPPLFFINDGRPTSPRVANEPTGLDLKWWLTHFLRVWVSFRSCASIHLCYKRQPRVSAEPPQAADEPDNFLLWARLAAVLWLLPSRGRGTFFFTAGCACVCVCGKERGRERRVFNAWSIVICLVWCWHIYWRSSSKYKLCSICLGDICDWLAQLNTQFKRSNKAKKKKKNST